MVIEYIFPHLHHAFAEPGLHRCAQADRSKSLCDERN